MVRSRFLGRKWVAKIEGLGTPLLSTVERVPFAYPLQQADALFAADGRRSQSAPRTSPR